MKYDNQTPPSTGIAGLDDILRGSLAKGFLYLIEGNPGAGKTTLALQFLIEGAKRGEKGLYISLAESDAELRHVADSHGMSLNNVEICKISTPINGAEYARLTVADTGGGIHKEIRKDLFKQFFTTKGSGGTGLGLWLTRDIMHRNGGRLRFRSRTESPSGTVFVMYLPSTPVAQQDAGKVQSREERVAAAS